MSFGKRFRFHPVIILSFSWESSSLAKKRNQPMRKNLGTLWHFFWHCKFIVKGRMWMLHPSRRYCVSTRKQTLFRCWYIARSCNIYIFDTLSGGKSCLVAPGVAVPPWATETVLSPRLAADEDRVSHVLSHVVWWKFKKNSAKYDLWLWL